MQRGTNLDIKLVFTVTTLVFGVLAVLLDLSNLKAGPDSHWRLGRADPCRNLFFTRDGSFRKHGKLIFLAWGVVFLVILWML